MVSVERSSTNVDIHAAAWTTASFVFPLIWYSLLSCNGLGNNWYNRVNVTFYVAVCLIPDRPNLTGVAGSPGGRRLRASWTRMVRVIDQYAYSWCGYVIRSRRQDSGPGSLVAVPVVMLRLYCDEIPSPPDCTGCMESHTSHAV